MNVSFSLESILGSTLRFACLDVDETLGEVGSMMVEALSPGTHLCLENLLGTSMTITMTSSTGYRRHFGGLVAEAMSEGEVFVDDVRFLLYRFRLVPRLWLLGKSMNSRIFKHVTIPEMVIRVCRDHGVTDIDNRLVTTYPVRDYCVQYRESALDFIRRLMEGAGIYFHIEYRDGREVIVLSDATSSHDMAKGFEELSFIPDAFWGRRTAASVTAWSSSCLLVTGRVSLGDYDYLHPRATLGASEGGDSSMKDMPSIADFPARGDGFCQDGAEIQRQARVRWESMNLQRVGFRGRTDAIGLAAGCRFSLRDHPSPEANGDYLVTGTTIRWRGASYRSEGEDPVVGEPTCSCSFAAIPAKHDYRLPQITARPIIHGVQTAVVYGESSDEDVVVDTYGRVQVTFFWADGNDKAATSCPVRVASTWAGNRWGAISLPRVGQEVVVCFLEGDPDRPLIIGSVYNQDHMPPYALPDGRTRSGMLSRSVKGGAGEANEIRFEDRQGKEELYLHAQRDLREQAENDHVVMVERDTKTTSGRDFSADIGRDRKQDVGRDDTLNVGRKLRIQALDQIDLSVGPARLVMKKTGEVQITGTMVKINGMASAEMSGGGTLAIKAGASLSLVAGATVSMTGGAAVSVNAGAALTLSAVGPAVLKGLPPLLG